MAILLNLVKKPHILISYTHVQLLLFNWGLGGLRVYTAYPYVTTKAEPLNYLHDEVMNSLSFRLYKNKLMSLAIVCTTPAVLRMSKKDNV